MPLWDWALLVYGRPGVAPAALALQDDHGQNVSFLLWSVWAGTDEAGALQRGAAIARTWDRTVLHPLRQVRIDLKPEFDGVDQDRKGELREAIKATELGAEKLLLEALERLTRKRGLVAAGPALAAASNAWGEPPAEAALARLVLAVNGGG